MLHLRQQMSVILLVSIKFLGAPFKGIDHQKIIYSPLYYFKPVWLSLWSIKWDILNIVGNQTVLVTIVKISSFMFSQRKKFLQVWNDMKAGKWKWKRYVKAKCGNPYLEFVVCILPIQMVTKLPFLGELSLFDIIPLFSLLIKQHYSIFPFLKLQFS